VATLKALSFKTNNRFLSKKMKAAYFTGAFLLLSFGVYNSVTQYPLRWSEAFFSKKNSINQFGLNPILYFFDSFAFRSEGIDMEKLQTYYPVTAPMSFYGNPLNSTPKMDSILKESASFS
jgi:hypothetical protein